MNSQCVSKPVGSPVSAIHRWAVVLSGGEGKRLAPLVKRWLGCNRPKQYCTFVGSRSMLRHTIDRALRLVPSRHTVTVIGRGHQDFISPLDVPPRSGKVIEQPHALGTLPGVLLPSMCIWSCDPEATLLILPSDHFIHPESRFVKHAARAFALAEQFSDRIVLLGSKASRPETDYGWIVPERPGRHPTFEKQSVHQVVQFHEKPSLPTARRFYSAGYLWNTMIFAVKAKTLRDLAYTNFPAMARTFESLRTLYFGDCDCRLRAQEECIALANAYRGVRARDFSGELLEQNTHRIVVLEMNGVEWCDWGRPERILEGLSRIGKKPLFPEGWVPRHGPGKTAKTAEEESLPVPA